MSRIGATFERLRARGERALVVYLTAGDPSLADTRRLVVEMARHLLGENWMKEFVDKANRGGIERVLL